ncbi:MAG TPA: hypothetical protein VF618_24065 [Thermoanaerobaculia bacterium]
MTHYDDEALFQFAEGTSPIAGEIEAHVACCEHCAVELEAHRDIVVALGTEDAWTDEPKPAPKQVVMDVMAFAERARHEDAQAAILCDEILSGPASWWSTKLRKAEGVWTAGMVRQLLERMRLELERAPINALHVTMLAIEVSNELSVAEYPCDYVVKLRAQSLRDYAYVLSFMGRFPEALETAERSRRLFEQVPLPEFDLARLDLVLASIVSSMDRLSEATRLAQKAAETFLRFGDRPRFLNARLTEASYCFRSGDIDSALTVWSSIENDADLEPVSRVRTKQNIALCHRQLGQLDRAVEYLMQTSAEFDMLGLTTERTRARWSLGQTLVTAGRPKDALPMLRQAWREFEQLDLIADSALVGLELAEALLITGEAAEVPTICREIIARFSRAGMASRAMNALSFLREAIALGQAKPSLVRHVYEFLRELPAERPRLYAPSPVGRLED